MFVRKYSCNIQFKIAGSRLYVRVQISPKFSNIVKYTVPSFRASLKVFAFLNPVLFCCTEGMVNLYVYREDAVDTQYRFRIHG